MLNKIWFCLLCIGILYGFGKASYQTATGTNSAQPEAQAAPANASEPEAKGNTPMEAMGKRLTDATLDAATTAVELCITLIGIMALWLGLMNIARDGGLVDAFARMLRPLMRWLFPGIPDGHPAQGAILMNLSANMLGLDNAATPMGLKAMTELQTLNPVKDTATNSMAMFLAINNSSVTLIPITIIGFRAATGSLSPTEPLAGTLIVTTISTVSAVFIARWLSRGPLIRLPPKGRSPQHPMKRHAAREAPMDSLRQAFEVVSAWAIPAVILLIIVWGAAKRVPLYESFVTGAKEGFGIAIMIIPYLVAMLFVVKVFMASGIFDDIKYGLVLAMQGIGLGGYTESLDLLPLALTKPLTGSGARAVMVDMFEQHGPDSFLGMTASIMMGSTETTFYILTVYYGAVQIKKFRHTLAACLWTDVVAVTAAIIFGYMFYGGR